MNGRNSLSVNFKGYDARPLYALVMRNTRGFALGEAAHQMRQIGMEHGFKVLLEDETMFSTTGEERQRAAKNSKGEPIRPVSKNDGLRLLDFIKEKTLSCFKNGEKPNVTSWMQDCVYFTKDGLLASENNAESFTPLADTFKTDINTVSKSDFIQGGNLYILKDGDREKILVGNSENPKKVAKMFPGREIVQIPQADFHIDLFIRPLKDNTVLVADDDMTLGILKDAASALEKLMQEGDENYKEEELKKAFNNLQVLIWQMGSGRKTPEHKSTENVIKTLENNGFHVVRTPGRVCRNILFMINSQASIENKLNFMNAIALEDKDGEIVYISNKSNLLDELGISPELAKKIGLNFEEGFKKSIEEYVKPENVYFIEGAPHKPFCSHRNIPNILQYMGGGIHCLCAEVPKEAVNK